MNAPEPVPTGGPSPSHVDHEKDHEMDQAAAARLKMGWGQRAVVLLLLTVVIVPPLAGFYSYFSGIPLHLLAAKVPDEESEDAAVERGVSLVEGRPHTIEVSETVAERFKIKNGEREAIALAKPPTTMRPLVLPGSTRLDPTRLDRIRARFAPARVIEIAEVHDFPRIGGRSEFRELRPGDKVSKGDLLGIFYSPDVASKKNDLLDALVQLDLDQKILDEARIHREAVPNVFMITYDRAVQGDRNAINRALNNLKLWDIPQEEIDALLAEARKICADKDSWAKTPEGRWASRKKPASGGTINPVKEEENPWGKVTLRADREGVIVERTVGKGEMVVDNTVNLFQIADVSRLQVIVNCPEDDLPKLEDLGPDDRKWTIHTVGAGSSAGLPGTIDVIGWLIDPNQHTAVITGYVENPGERIRAGQYCTATVHIPPPDDVVEIPVDALVDDGRQSVVFVQPDPAKTQFTMRRVHVTHRFDRTVFVRKTPVPKEEQLTATEAEEGLLPQEPIRPNERILEAGVIELKRVVVDLESRHHETPADRLAKAKTGPASGPDSRGEQKLKAGKG